ncbi:hypothetical protein M0802_004915 [Mischocyttarus mexicanus]|nr:hypothetical protein M0802_004915 [Mischocyttarus mexicanus]
MKRGTVGEVDAVGVAHRRAIISRIHWIVRENIGETTKSWAAHSSRGKLGHTEGTTAKRQPPPPPPPTPAR